MTQRTTCGKARAMVLLMALSICGYSAPQTAESGKEVIQLFNGKDLSGFYTWLMKTGYGDPDRVFSVVDQIDGAPAIRVSGRHWGGLVTREEFSDYHLVVELRWGLVTWGERKDRAKDSGILVHCQGPDGNTSKDFNGPWMQSIECQIIQGGVGDIILVEGYDAAGNRSGPRLTVQAGRDRDGEAVYDPAAAPGGFLRGRINWFGRDPDWRDALGYRGGRDVEGPDGQWTRVEIICKGGSITNIVNGTVVNAGTRASLTRGKITLQSEGAEIYFRRVELRLFR
ncbi:MAG: DUF1080 domain-containing protein [Acidobacteria bacterium]|nr:DUF1080 domain-containing protein [Acidobacteriota bacterium]